MHQVNKQYRRLISRCAILITVAFLGAGCWHGKGASGGKDTANEPVVVSFIAPVEKSLARVVEQPGTIQPDEMASLCPKVAGYVKKVLVDIGQEVKQDAPLCEIYVPELAEEELEKKARVELAEAVITQARRALDVAKSQGEEAKAALARAEAIHERWELEDKRAATLVDRGVIDQQTLDEARGQFKAATAAREEARARLTAVASTVAKAEADVVAMIAKRNVAAAELRRTQQLVKYTTIRSPFDGVVTWRDVNTGDLVRASDSKPLFQVTRLDPVRVVVQVPETDAGLVNEGMPITLSIQSLGGQPFEAKVTRTSWMLSAGARTLRLEADLANESRRYRPGMYVYSKLVGQLPKGWTLPTTAVVRLGDQMAVYQVVAGKAVQTPVEVGHTHSGHIQVLRWQKQGTKPVWMPFTGEEQVLAKAAGLFDGQPVEVQSRPE